MATLPAKAVQRYGIGFDGAGTFWGVLGLLGRFRGFFQYPLGMGCDGAGTFWGVLGLFRGFFPVSAGLGVFVPLRYGYFAGRKCSRKGGMV